MPSALMIVDVQPGEIGAVALGYRVVVVADGHTTWDTPVIDADRIIAHRNRLFSRGFPDVVAASDVSF